MSNITSKWILTLCGERWPLWSNDRSENGTDQRRSYWNRHTYLMNCFCFWPLRFIRPRSRSRYKTIDLIHWNEAKVLLQLNIAIELQETNNLNKSTNNDVLKIHKPDDSRQLVFYLDRVINRFDCFKLILIRDSCAIFII